LALGLSPLRVDARVPSNGQSRTKDLLVSTHLGEFCLNFPFVTFDTNGMESAKFVSVFRRDSDEVIGAARLSAIEGILIEILPGGRTQLLARTTSGDHSFVSMSLPRVIEGQAMLARFRDFATGLHQQDPVQAYADAISDYEHARKEAEAAAANAHRQRELAEVASLWQPPSR
jgi:hypothetical protein